MTKTRTEHDSLGPVELPAEALYGPQTQRAAENFPVSGWPMPRRFLAALGRIKQGAAIETSLDKRLKELGRDAEIQNRLDALKAQVSGSGESAAGE